MADEAEVGEKQPPADSSPQENADKATLQRLKSLEKECKRLASSVGWFYQKYDFIHTPNDIDRSKSLEKDSDSDQSEDERSPIHSPKPEIKKVSLAEWAVLLQKPGPNSSLLTVAPKRQGDIGVSSHAIDKHVHGDKTPKEDTDHRNRPAYRVILEGRAGLMEVLGDIFSSQSLPGPYIWLWPFKYLIDYGDKLRLRLEEMEADTGEKDRDCVQKVHNKPPCPMKAHENIDQQPCASPKTCGSDNELSVEKQHVATKSPTVINAVGGSDTGFLALSRAKWHETSGERATGSREAAQDRRSHKLGGSDPKLKDELRCIVQFMDHEMDSIFTAKKKIDDGSKRTIAYDYLWLLFRPGTLVVTRDLQPRAYCVLHVTGGRALERTALDTDPRGRPEYDDLYGVERARREALHVKYPRTSPFTVDCFFVDFDGTNFGPSSKTFVIEEYDGERSISSLELYPLKFAEDATQSRRDLVKRGKRFRQLARVDHKHYAGRTITEPDILEVQSEVRGEIVIDFKLATEKFNKERKSRPDWHSIYSKNVLAEPTPADLREVAGFAPRTPTMYSGQPIRSFYTEDAAYDNELRAKFMETTTLLRKSAYDEPLSDEHYMLLPPRVYGFSLHDRKWYAFDIDKVQDIKPSPRGFDQLVLPDNHKTIMQALVAQHMTRPNQSKDQADENPEGFSMDVVRGKGRGLIILLHGVPGVGKTSTAECVAAQTQRPLFPITCGDLGTNPREVEATLTEYFDMAHKWGCVLLLDEADVFLAKRQRDGDLERNGVVSVFLRVLEYYSGILILTTNRIGQFDEAFSSRVHIKLYYPKLDRKSTMEIWKMNLQRIKESDLDFKVKEKEIKEFARKLWNDSKKKQAHRWNGRQIRNAFQTAIALAKWKALKDGSSQACLSAQEFAVVDETSAHFDDYICHMHGLEGFDAYETLAGREQLRWNQNARTAVDRASPTATVPEQLHSPSNHLPPRIPSTGYYASGLGTEKKGANSSDDDDSDDSEDE